MNWRNIKLVWLRELRDQLRDRRTLFMVAVLPLFMYPLLGTSFLQLSQFLQKHKATVALSGYDQLSGIEGLPPLVDGDRFAQDLFSSEQEAALLEVQVSQSDAPETEAKELNRKLKMGEVDAVVVLPSDFGRLLEEAREQTQRLSRGEPLEPGKSLRPPKATILFGAREASREARRRVHLVLARWTQKLMAKNLSDGNLPQSLAQPVVIQSQDIASESQHRANTWAKLLPFVVFLWALTGAFYPAVDLCAGEKERGTLETLLASPAKRGEIVWGKLLTVIVFSIATALLNLASLGATGHFVLGSLGAATGDGGLGMPPISSLLWLVVALPPVAALFGALSIACASFAKSTKEGQYYFMPLFMAAMPLMLFPMSPGVELNLGNSLVPLMGVVLLLRSLIEGQYLEALQYAAPVILVTFACCWMAVSWAVFQFNQESVLFREGERFSVGQWLKKLVREPKEMPTAGMAVACVAFIFLFKFFADMSVASLAPQPPDQRTLAISVIVGQACILAPALLMALFLVKQHGRALLGVVNNQTLLGVIIAVVLAVLAHPVGFWANQQLSQVFPPPEELVGQLEELNHLMMQASPWLLVLLMGVLPGVCEEITFRGFVLGGLRKTVPTVWAIGVSAFAFGAVHAVLSQSVSAGVIGILLGYMAVRWGSVWPSMAFHATYNSLMMIFARYLGMISDVEQKTGWRRLLHWDDSVVSGYHGAVVFLAALGIGILLLIVERSRPRATTMADPAS